MKKIFEKIGKRFHRTYTIKQWLFISVLFSLNLLLTRMIMSGRLSYGFLAWNLVLAFVPYFISDWLSRRPHILKQKWKLLPIVFLWLLFMPNSFYILTDLFHLETISNGHPWFDLTLTLSFAWNGILVGVLSIRQMETILKKGKGKFVSDIVIAAVMWLNAFGVYIGRFLRFSSWDVFINPFSLLKEIDNIVFSPYEYRYAWMMSFCFACFMIIIYYSIKKLSEEFKNG